MRKIIALVVGIVFIQCSYAQQIIGSSQYMNNDYAYNTAVAGTKANLRVSLGTRKQWFGFQNSPGVQNLTFQGRVAKNIGLGAQLYNDTWGLSRKTGANIGVNYILQANEALDVSFGLSLSAEQFSINRSKVVTEIPDDAAVYDGLNNQFFPNFGFSSYIHSKKFYAGVNVANLLEVKTDLINGGQSPNYLNRTIHLIGGLDIPLSEKLVLIPSGIFGYTFNATSQFQLDAKVEYNKLLWLGFGYRSQDAIVANIGAYIKTFTVGYSYDYTVSSLRGNVGSGSHELFVAFDIVKKDNKSSWFKRNRIYNSNR